MHPLLYILPPELVYYIIQITRQTDAIKVIVYYHFYFYAKNYYMKQVLKYAIYDPFSHYYDEIIGFKRLETSTILDTEFLYSLKFILYNNYNRIKYNNLFWKKLLGVISNRIMTGYNYIICNRKINNSDLQYKNYKNSVSIWFQLCKKHNIKLLISNNKISKNVNGYSEIFARHIIKILHFNNMRYAPSVFLNNYDDLIHIDSACRILKEQSLMRLI
jgi:hypothetical protein